MFDDSATTGDAEFVRLDRRALLGGIGAMAAAAFAGPALGAARKLSAGDKVNIAVIGAGGQGASNMNKLTGENIVAACDVDFDHVRAALVNRDGAINPARQGLKDAYDKTTRYADYRRMFDAQKDIDAVLIATPDHHHAVAARMAMERGLHVYVQKPLTYTVEEGRKLLAMARANPNLITQMGNQGHSGDDGRRTVELIRGGLIGKVKEVHIWTNRPVWPQGINRPPPQPKPANLDWQTWLGPADIDWEYHNDYAHFNWRGWLPFGTGALGDMGAHLVDFPVWALEPGLPTRIETRHTRWGDIPRAAGVTTPAVHASYPLGSVTHYVFGKAKGGPIQMTWYDGGLMPATPVAFPAGLKMNRDGGVLFVGSKGMIMHETYGDKPTLIGKGLEEAAKKIPVSLPRIKGGKDAHELNWVRAIRGEEKISCPFEYAVPLNETMNLGVVAMRAEQPIEYDGVAGKITNAPEANAFLSRVYRKGWELNA
jgi:predicted dehydrogenase